MLYKALFHHIGSIALSVFLVAAPLAAQANQPTPQQTIVLAGGCFWGIQAVFQHVKGVQSAISGYAGGEASTAQYHKVSSGTTGHAESVQVTYDPTQITEDQLLKIYLSVAHNPTELNRQGPDHGTQYRSAIFYATEEQKKIAEASLQDMTKSGQYNSPIVTTLESLTSFYPAESYHQNYAKLHPHDGYIMIYDAPKVALLANTFPQLYQP
jgi:peptide-methionine (S)-S-oxide reductase